MLAGPGWAGLGLPDLAGLDWSRWELAEMSRRFMLVGILVVVEPGTVTQSESRSRFERLARIANDRA